MTFDQWWNANWPRIKHEAVISEAQYMSCLSAFQACWNMALDEVQHEALMLANIDREEGTDEFKFVNRRCLQLFENAIKLTKTS